MRRALTAAILCLAFTGCPFWNVATEKKDGCEPTATRCNENVAEICGSDKRWDTNMDCSEVTGPDDQQSFVCCETPDGHTCLPSCEEN